MKRILLTLVAAAFLAVVTVPSGAQQPRPLFRPRPMTLPWKAVPPQYTAPAIPASIMVHGRLLARKQMEAHEHKKTDKKTGQKSRVQPRPRAVPFRGFDWTMLGIATRVRDQGHAGTCWARLSCGKAGAGVHLRSASAGWRKPSASMPAASSRTRACSRKRASAPKR